MLKVIGTTLIRHIKPNGKQFDVRDEKLTGFMIRVYPSGVMTYMVELGRGNRKVLGRVGVIDPDEARELAKAALRAPSFAQTIIPTLVPTSNTSLPTSAILNQQVPTLNEFIDQHYITHTITHHKRGINAVNRLRTTFCPKFGNTKLAEIDTHTIEIWVASRIQKGISKATINRDLTDLKSAINKALQWGLIPFNPLKNHKPFKLDKFPKTRYLLPHEETALRQALENNPLNYIKPLIILALNTGMRRGELLSLTWPDINFQSNMITLQPKHTKTGLTEYVHLNSEAREVLKAVKAYHQNREWNSEWVFLTNAGRRIFSVQKVFQTVLRHADITRFRFHDLRHTFASKLVMAGVDLNTVRELMRHASIEMTLRYAHLAPEHKMAAVEKLVNGNPN